MARQRTKDTGRPLLTRAEVRALLGKSISSIRRYEDGGLLHPGIDADGVHWFERGEVEKLGRRLKRSQPQEVVISARDGRRVAAQLGLQWPFSGAALAHAAEQLRARARALAARRPTAGAAIELEA